MVHQLIQPAPTVRTFAVFVRGDEGLDHLTTDKIAAELIELPSASCYGPRNRYPALRQDLAADNESIASATVVPAIG